MSDQSVLNTASAAVAEATQVTGAGVVQQAVGLVSEGAAIVADIKEDVADLKAGKLPTDILKQIEDAEAFASAVLSLGATLSADFGVSPATLKNAIPEVIALIKKII